MPINLPKAIIPTTIAPLTKKGAKGTASAVTAGIIPARIAPNFTAAIALIETTIAANNGIIATIAGVNNVNPITIACTGLGKPFKNSAAFVIPSTKSSNAGNNASVNENFRKLNFSPI